MANTALGSKAVGSTIKLNVNGTAKEFIVVHQGKPSSIYDDSCNGVWLLMKDIYENRQWHSSDVNDYANSTIHSYLNSTFLAMFDTNIQKAIKQVKIPYRAGSGYGKTVTSGTNGLSAKIFLLSSNEVAFSHGYMPTGEGATLSYFSGCAANSTDTKRVAYLNGSATVWWLRSPFCDSLYGSQYALYVGSYGYWGSSFCSGSRGVRPALVLPSTLLVSDDGTVSTNTPPVITTEYGTQSGKLGTKSAPFAVKYTVNDDQDKTVSVKYSVLYPWPSNLVPKPKISATRTVPVGVEQTIPELASAAAFQKLVNGQYGISITATDSSGDKSETCYLQFTKSVTSASITMSKPLSIDGTITVAALQVVGSIPEDTEYKVEVTNNGKDPHPVWQDCTEEVKAGNNIVFQNTTAKNGAAFNFRITVSRGASGTGGYISVVSGAFQ